MQLGKERGGGLDPMNAGLDPRAWRFAPDARCGNERGRGLDPANVGLDPEAWRYAPDA